MVAGLAAACSSDIARFDADPFANPFRSRGGDPVTTGSINRPGAPPRAMVIQPAQSVASAPIPSAPVTTSALPPPSQPMIGNPGVPSPVAPGVTGSVGSANYPNLAPAPRPAATAISPSTGWTAAGGTPVTLQQGESIATLSNRYGVPASALLAVNGLSSPAQAQPGQQIIIPAYNPVSAGKPVAAATQATATQATSTITRAKTEAPKKVAELTPPAPVAPQIAAPKISAPKSEAPRIETPRIETPKVAAPKVEAPKVEAPRAAPARQVLQTTQSEAEKRAAEKLKALKEQPKSEPAEKKAEAKPAPAPRKLVETKKTKPADDVETTSSIPAPGLPAKTAPMVARNEPARTEAAKPAESEKPAEAAADTPEFRWPARGRVISGFGARGTGGANDGINIALPEGTPVKAAEGGTVVHADDALKGYGKLVLIRHPNGYVSVYAHNGDLKVKRGESVKRGQVIATSGQSGNVTAPQLHFEIRKGATPVDPSKYLGG